MNRVILCLKRNDQYNPKQKNAGHKHLMPIFWWDESVQGELDLTTSRLQTEAFVHLIVNRNLIPWLKEICTPVSDGLEESSGLAINEKFKRERKYVFKDSIFKTLVKDNKIDSKMAGPGFIPAIDVTDQDLTKFVKHSENIDWSRKRPKLDVKAVTSGTYTFGTGGGDDYVTASACAADCGTQTAELNFNMNSDVTETATATFNHDDGGFDLNIGSTNPHSGVVTDGFTQSVGHSGINFRLDVTGAGTAYVSDFYIKRTVTVSSANRALIWVQSSASSAVIHDMFLNADGFGGVGLYLYNSNAAYDRWAYNCVVWDCAIGVKNGSNSSSKGSAFENIYIRNCSTAGLDNAARGGKYRNIFSASNTTDYANTTSATGDGISATDTTDFGTGSNGSLTEADEVLSTDDTSADFGHLKSGGTNEGGGVVPTYAVVDMAGITYASAYPVGPFMLSLAAGSPYFYYLQQQLLAG